MADLDDVLTDVGGADDAGGEESVSAAVVAIEHVAEDGADEPLPEVAAVEEEDEVEEQPEVMRRPEVVEARRLPQPRGREQRDHAEDRLRHHA